MITIIFGQSIVIIGLMVMWCRTACISESNQRKLRASLAGQKQANEHLEAKLQRECDMFSDMKAEAELRYNELITARQDLKSATAKVRRLEADLRQSRSGLESLDKCIQGLKPQADAYIKVRNLVLLTEEEQSL